MDVSQIDDSIFPDAPRLGDSDAPEVLLWRSCLWQAYLDLRDRKQKGAALGWFEARSSEVGGFSWICHLLGLDERRMLALARVLVRGEGPLPVRLRY